VSKFSYAFLEVSYFYKFEVPEEFVTPNRILTDTSSEIDKLTKLWDERDT